MAATATIVADKVRAPRRRRCACAADIAQLHASMTLLQREVERLRERVEGPRGPRDSVDLDLHAAVCAVTFGEAAFTSDELRQRAELSTRLRAALSDANITSTRELAAWLKRIQNISIAGFKIVRVPRRRLWLCITASSDASATSA